MQLILPREDKLLILPHMREDKYLSSLSLHFHYLACNKLVYYCSENVIIIIICVSIYLLFVIYICCNILFIFIFIFLFIL